VLFTLLAERYERGSVLLTSNLPFSKWEAIFKDPMTTAAAIDRLVHHSVVLEMNIPSYRVEQAKKIRDQQNRAPVERLAAEVQRITEENVQLAYVDQGYTGEAASKHGIQLEVIKHTEAKRGFVLLPRRWVVERSFA